MSRSVVFAFNVSILEGKQILRQITILRGGHHLSALALTVLPMSILRPRRWALRPGRGRQLVYPGCRLRCGLGPSPLHVSLSQQPSGTSSSHWQMARAEEAEPNQASTFQEVTGDSSANSLVT